MSNPLLLVGRRVARAADVLVHNRDRRKRVRQFHRVTRVTLVAESHTAEGHSSSGLSTLDRPS